MWGVNRFVTFLLEWADSRGLENSCGHGQSVTLFRFDILTNPSVKASLICHTPFPRWERTNERHRKELAAWSYTLLPHNNFGMAPFCSSPPNSALRTLQKEICHISNLHLNTTQNYGFLTFPIYICTQLKLNIFQSTFAHNSRFPIYICTQLKWKILDFSDFQRPFTCKVPMVCTRNFHLEWRNCEW